MKIKIKCKNIAPLRNLDATIEGGAFNFGILARNGSGKTFLSRLFRTLETFDNSDVNSVDRLITLGQTNAQFGFNIIDKDGNTKEDISIDISKGHIPTIPSHNYIYHTFNQDYVDDNIRALGFEHSSDVQGYILGKTNIDISSDKSKLETLEQEQNHLYQDIVSKINAYIESTLLPIRDIRRLSEFTEYISADIFLNNGSAKRISLPKQISEYIKDYDKVKSVPEGLSDIIELSLLRYDNELYDEIATILSTEYSISHFAEDFKTKIRDKQKFIEDGLKILGNERIKCPFCEQELKTDALTLIDRYVDFFADEEVKVSKRILALIQTLKDEQKSLKGIVSKTNEVASKYNEYKNKYIPSCEGNTIRSIEIEQLVEIQDSIINSLETKLKNISVQVSIDGSTFSQIESIIASIDHVTDENNRLVRDINRRKNTIGEESKNIRRNICKAAYNDWIEKFGNEQKKFIEYTEQAKEIRKEIAQKQETERISKKKLVAETIKKVLDYFFSGKYTLDGESFRLVFNKNVLESGQTKDVLSEGEKNIVTFAYYLGDTHTLIEKEDDYNKLIFVVDDPISSMDFTYVYTISDVIRDMDTLFPQITRHVRKLVLTHNNDFIRILDSNNILSKVMYLRGEQLINIRDNHTVPYINHLLDIYRIARCGENATHTTANSIRHIFETINKFENIDTNRDSLKEFIKDEIANDKKVFTFINDLSHGGWRTEQEPMLDEDYREICETVIALIEKRYPQQIEYCKNHA